MRATTYLGDNTVTILDDLVERLRADGFDITVDRTAGRSSPDARQHARDVDLVWMCGSLAAVLLDDGTLDHDIVAAPVFPGEADPVYRSVLVVRDDGPMIINQALDGCVGINETDSWSGHHGLRSFLAHEGIERWFAQESVTGSHRASIDAVASHACDVVAVDQTIWRSVVAAEPHAVAGLRVLTTTHDWPAPPFLLSPAAPSEIAERLTELQPIGLDRIVAADATRYRTLLPAQ